MWCKWLLCPKKKKKKERESRGAHLCSLEFKGPLKPLQITSVLKQVQEAGYKEGVVVQKPWRLRRPHPKAASQPLALLIVQLRSYEQRRSLRCCQVLFWLCSPPTKNPWGSKRSKNKLLRLQNRVPLTILETRVGVVCRWMKWYQCESASVLVPKNLPVGIELAIPVKYRYLVGMSRWENRCIPELLFGLVFGLIPL
jgi:hypothetical protein